MSDVCIHSLKTWPEHYEAIVAGTKRFEIRKDDRGFKVGDVLTLLEWKPSAQVYTRRGVSVRVTYLLHGPDFGLPADMCVMSIAPLSSPPPPSGEGGK